MDSPARGGGLGGDPRGLRHFFFLRGGPLEKKIIKRKNSFMSMKILKTIRDKDLGLDFQNPSVYEREREAARAIVFDKDNNIALLHATNKSYHKLPGGGVEKGEDIIQALKREVLEEIGCEIDSIKELGIIEEYRNKFSLHQLSY